jgi:NAD(P)-dependent dehydrogenase (short-subunit alcohol dehydrogenase family)
MLLSPLDHGLSGKRILVTGASRGIGASTARRFAALGAKVGIHCRERHPGADAVAADCSGSEVFAADLSAAGTVRPLLDAFLAWAGGIDVLVNNAGGVPGERAACFRLNLDAPIELMDAAWPHLAATRAGSIVNVSSVVAGRAASARLADYAVAKAGLEQATRNRALAGAPAGIRVNTVRPGLTDTDLNRWADDPDRSRWTARIARVPMGRAARPDEIAAAIVFLASDLASYTTGTVLTVAGGE